LKRRLLVAAVREAGSKSAAAEKLGIPRQSLQKMMKRLQITDAELREDGADGSDFDRG
jgi:transcriptional regulator with GAF, ATPase, and Fis domain